jgi:hypothetical protein
MKRFSLSISKDLLKSKEITNSFFYKKVVDLITNKEDSLVLNTGEDKAVKMLIGIFRNSETVHLFCNNEKPNVTDNPIYELAVRSFLNRKGKVYLVVKKDIDFEKAFRVYKLLYVYAHERPNLVKIAVANEDFINSVKDVFNNKINNFCIGDERFVRVEHDTTKFLAKASDYPELGKKLSDIIESYIEKEDILKKIEVSRETELLVS